MKSIAVFCGSKDGYLDLYHEEAYRLGATLAERGINVVYGGAKVGLMGAVAEGVLNNDGRIAGVIPHFLQTKEVAHEGLTELIVVNTMHERKMKMYDRCDSVIVLPGGWGTMDEMFEMLTWGYLGVHEKPVGLLNVNGYYDPLKAMNTMMVQEGFLSEWARSILIFEPEIDSLLERMENYEPPQLPKVIDKQAT